MDELYYNISVVIRQNQFLQKFAESRFAISLQGNELEMMVKLAF